CCVVIHSSLSFSSLLPLFPLFLFCPLLPPPPRSTLFPYTTLFRSDYHYDFQRRNGRCSCQCWFWSRSCWLDPLDHRQVNQLLQADRKSTRLNSSHVSISYAVFCLKKKKNTKNEKK